MNHALYTIYLLLNIALLYILRIEALSVSTVILGFVFWQYFYWICTLERVPQFYAFQRCAACDKMTPQHYIHCDKCKKCVGVDRTHYDVLSTCTLPSHYNRYICLLRGLITLNTVLSVLMGLVYGWTSMVFVLVHLYFLKSTYKKDIRDIYVK